MGIFTLQVPFSVGSGSVGHGSSLIPSAEGRSGKLKWRHGAGEWHLTEKVSIYVEAARLSAHERDAKVIPRVGLEAELKVEVIHSRDAKLEESK